MGQLNKNEIEVSLSLNSCQLWTFCTRGHFLTVTTSLRPSLQAANSWWLDQKKFSCKLFSSFAGRDHSYVTLSLFPPLSTLSLPLLLFPFICTCRQVYMMSSLFPVSRTLPFYTSTHYFLLPILFPKSISSAWLVSISICLVINRGGRSKVVHLSVYLNLRTLSATMFLEVHFDYIKVLVSSPCSTLSLCN